MATVSWPLCRDSTQFSNIGELNLNLLNQPIPVMKAIKHSCFVLFSVRLLQSQLKIGYKESTCWPGVRPYVLGEGLKA